ncbi:MAG: hypothetical protein HAW59_07020, partial [Betaproteobacteria bacterium]|nr:hypothetical protein [Betaproteobacteria bacterium]
KAGTLDDVSWLNPAYHIWVKSAQPWLLPLLAKKRRYQKGEPPDATPHKTKP